MESNYGLRPYSRSFVCVRGFLLFFLSLDVVSAQNRLRGPLDLSRSAPLAHSLPRVSAAYDQGRVESEFQLPSVSVLLKPGSAQQAELDQLLMEQQDRSSLNYHRWLTPDQFAGRFGATDSDIATLVQWLTSQGLRVDNVARSRQWIIFSGSAGNIGRALHTEIHRYRINGRDHFGNATPLSVPAAFEDIVGGFVGLDDFFRSGPVLPAKTVEPESTQPNYTSPHKNHYLAPADFATIYGIDPLYSAGIDGTGQTIAVVGTSDIDVSDIEAFQTRMNLPVIDPQIITYGGDPGFNFGTMLEADLDVEWSNAVAPKAKIIYLNARGPLLGVQYVLDTNIASIISMSYGYCEAAATPAQEVLGQQANAQGITWIAASGDSGAAQCDRQDGYPEAGKGLAVNLPASMPEVTAVGGTQFNEGSGTYWSAVNGAGMSSALSYIPEIAWNETIDGNSLGATGGGASIFYSKPLWQTGTGVPNDNARDVPDVALSASAAHDGYLVFSSGGLFAVGGTSAPTPAFAGMVALLSQYLTSKGLEKQPGLGNINPSLYRLAQTTQSAFHDITSGDNIVPCVQGSPDCFDGSIGYSAGHGYDRVTGLGSVDLNNLVTHWKSGAPTSTKLTANPTTIGINSGTVQLTATVTASGTPTGTVDFLYAENPLGTATLASHSGGASATLSVDANQLLMGTHPLIAVYGGDHTFDGSAGSVDITVTNPASGTAITPSIDNAPVLQNPPDANGLRWKADIRLTEDAGVGATVTGLAVNGVSYDSQLATIFKTTTIPPHQSISGTLGFASLAAPLTQTFVFTGKDTTGASWTAQISAEFIGALQVGPGIVLSTTPVSIVQNTANKSCPWQQQLIVQEVGGNYVSLTNFAMGALDLSDNISLVFGTTQMAPFNILSGTYCRSDAQPQETQIFDISGFTELGEQVEASATATYQPAAASSPAMSVSPASVTLTPATSTSVATAQVAVNFSAGTPEVAFSIVPSAATSWLHVAQAATASGTQLTLQATPGPLGNGVYSATIVVQAGDASPQFINIPVTMLAGDTSKIQIGGVSNAASSKQAFAPGMLMSVYGAGMAPAGTSQLAGALPLPLNLSGVSARVNGLTAPLYYLSPGQINVQVPYEASAGTAILGINNNGQVASFPFQIATSAPGIFTDGKGAIVPNGSGKVGDSLVLFITGAGDITPSIPTGFTPPSGIPIADLPHTLSPLAVTVGGVQAPVTFAGVPAGLVGVVQVNFTVPPKLAAGPQPVVVTVGGVAAPSATLTITQ